jgi:SAM-dependent methyltransferase
MAMTRRERAVRLLPMPMKSAAKAVRHAADPLFVAAYRRRTGDEEPIPPSSIRARSGSPGVKHYIPGGIEAADELQAVLAKYDRKLADFDSVYDFGCGAGRVLRRVVKQGKDGAKFSGSDVDGPAIAWAQEHLPEAQFKQSQYRPPLPYEDASFDLVYSISIFTHLNEQMQLEWLRELARVMRPGAVGLLTIHGDHAYGEASSGAFVSNSRSCMERIQSHGTLSDEGFVYEPYEISSWNKRDFPGIDDTFGITFHDQQYVRDKWSEMFEVLGIEPRSISDGWQDTVVVRKRDA